MWSRATGQRRSLPDLGPKGRHSVAQGVRRCGKIAALPPDLRKGSAFPYLGLNTKAFGAGALAGKPEGFPQIKRPSRRRPGSSDFLTPSQPWVGAPSPPHPLLLPQRGRGCRKGGRGAFPRAIALGYIMTPLWGSQSPGPDIGNFVSIFWRQAPGGVRD